jgi:hypothetical protein
MVLFQKYVRRFGPSTKMAPTAELSLTWNLWEIHIKIFSSETTGPIAINDSQNLAFPDFTFCNRVASL